MKRQEHLRKLIIFYKYLNLFQPQVVKCKKYMTGDVQKLYDGDTFVQFKFDEYMDIPRGEQYKNDLYEYEVIIGNIKNKSLYWNIQGTLDTVEQDNGASFLAYFKLDNSLKYKEGSFEISKFVFLMTKLHKKIYNSHNIEEEIQNFNKEIGVKVDSDKIISFDDIRYVTDCILNELKLSESVKKELSIMLNRRKVSENNQSSIMQLEFYDSELSMLLERIDEVNNHFIGELLLPKEILGEQVDNNIEYIKSVTKPSEMLEVKWPSKFNLSLMQEVAVHIATNSNCPSIFSVNGPPGTGKTTLLKEIIADTIYKKAQLIYEKGIDGLKGKKCETGSTDNYNRTYYEVPKELAELSIIVASNNNSAVENISKELPKASDVSKNKTTTGLFDVFTEDNKNIYFTKGANNLSENGNKNFGLISAPFGKKENINKILKLLPSSKNNSFSELTEECLEFSEIKEKFSQIRSDVLNIKECLQILHRDIDTINKIQQKLSDLNEESYIQQKEKLSNNKNKYILEIDRLREEKQFKKEARNIIKKIAVFLAGEKNSDISLINDQIQRINKKIDDIEKEEVFIESELQEIKKLKDDIYYLDLEIDELLDKLETEKNNDCIQFYNIVSENNLKEKNIQTICPWAIEKFNRKREELFYWSLKLIESYVVNSNWILQNLKRYSLIKSDEKNTYTEDEIRAIEKNGILTLSILIPVLSTTFASVGRAFDSIDREELGLVIIDEAGQATPLSTLGLLFRARRVISVGDPLQVEPIMATPLSIVRYFYNMLELNKDIHLNKQFLIGNERLSYSDLEMSVQILADASNPYYGVIGSTKVGCPLLVHRRCLEPMFSISNKISYDNQMVNATILENSIYLFGKSRFLDVKGEEKGNKDHYVEAQGEKVIELIHHAIQKLNGMDEKNDIFDKGELFLISPFTTVVKGIRKMCRNKQFPENWIRNNIGTVHAFQGKEANCVIVILGCSRGAESAVKWADLKPNILNVASTRAKKNLIIIGDKELWYKTNYFKVAIDELEKFNRHI